MGFQVIQVGVTVVVANNVQRKKRYIHYSYTVSPLAGGTNANKQEHCFHKFAEFSVGVSGRELYLPRARSSTQTWKLFQLIHHLKVLCCTFSFLKTRPDF